MKSKSQARESRLPMSTRYGHYSQSIPYSHSYIPRPIKIPSNRQNLESEAEQGEDEEHDFIEVPEDSEEAEGSIRNPSYRYEEDDPETDNSIEEEDMKEEESSSEIEERQLSYVSLPSLLLSSDSSNNLIPGDKRKSFSASPALSCESVAMELESDTEEQIEQDSQEPSEEVEDESSEYDQQDFVNVRVKVQKQPYAVFDDTVKVTVSVQPPSEIEDISDESHESDILESEGESNNSYSDEPSGDSESESINSYNEKKMGKKDTSYSGESNNESEAVEDDENESGIGEESDARKSSVSKKSDKLHKPWSKENENLQNTKEANEIMRVKTEKDERGEKYSKEIELLGQAIKTGETKIANDIANAFIARLTPTQTPSQSPFKIIPLKSEIIGTKEALISSPIKVVESILTGKGNTEIKSMGDNIDEKTEEGIKSLKTEIVEPVSDITRSLPQIPRSEIASPKVKPVIPRSQPASPKPSIPKSVVPATVPTSSVVTTSASKNPAIPNSQPGTPKPKTATPISQPTVSKSEPNIKKSPPQTPRPQSKILKPEPIPRPLSPKIIIANTNGIDSFTPQIAFPLITKIEPIITENVVEQLKPVISEDDPNKAKLKNLKGSQIVDFKDEPPKPELIQENVEEHANVSSPSSPQDIDKKSDEKDTKDDIEDYLSVYADSADTTDEDDDENTVQKQSKRQTLEEQEELKAAKDRLVELWKLNIQEDISDLDENFSTILDDMLTELKQGPVKPPIPPDIEALQTPEKVVTTKELPTEELEEQSEENMEMSEEMEEESPVENDQEDANLDSEQEKGTPEEMSENDQKDQKQQEMPIIKEEEEEIHENESEIPIVNVESEKPQNEKKEIPPETEQNDDGTPYVEDVKYGQEYLEQESEPQSPAKSVRKWNNSTEIASALSQYLTQIKTETVENNMAEIIPLLTHLLLGSRKNKSEHDLSTLIASMSAVRVLCERLIDIRVTIGEKGLKNVDLSWLLRVLCKISADPESKVKPEASFSLARLVTAAKPDLITRPIYFLLVMENEGYGHKKGAQGAKTKAAALDTLTYALLTFPKDEFDDLEEIARWVCLVLFHSQRRVRQSALECLAVIGNHIGSPDSAISLFRRLIVREKEFDVSRSDSGSDDFGSPKKSSGRGMVGFRSTMGMGIFDVSAVTAISTRLKRQKLPLPSSIGLIDYGVKVPTGKDLILILTKLQEIEENEFDVSSSAESFISGGMSNAESSVIEDSDTESIRMSDLERAANNKSTGLGETTNKSTILEEKQEEDVITADVAYILAGKGRVNKQEVVIVEDNFKQMDEMIPKEQQDLMNNGDEKETEKETEKPKKKKSRKRKEKQRSKQKPASDNENLQNESDEDDMMLRSRYIGLPPAKLIDIF